MIQTPRLASSAENEAAALVFGTGPDFAPAKMATRICPNVVRDAQSGFVGMA
jgi:hypothetical protein